MAKHAWMPLFFLLCMWLFTLSHFYIANLGHGPETAARLAGAQDKLASHKGEFWRPGSSIWLNLVGLRESTPNVVHLLFSGAVGFCFFLLALPLNVHYGPWKFFTLALSVSLFGAGVSLLYSPARIAPLGLNPVGALVGLGGGLSFSYRRTGVWALCALCGFLLVASALQADHPGWLGLTASLCGGATLGLAVPSKSDAQRPAPGEAKGSRALMALFVACLIAYEIVAFFKVGRNLWLIWKAE